MVFSLRRYAAGSGDGDDGLEIPAGMPVPAGKRAVRLVRIAGIVEHLMTSTHPKLEGLEKQFGVSRATLFRDLATPEFCEAMEESLNTQFAARVGKALSVLMGMLEDEKTPVTAKFRVATWLIDRFDRLSKAMSSGGGGSASARGSVGADGLTDEMREHLEQLVADHHAANVAEPQSAADAEEFVDVDEEDAEDAEVREGEAV